MQSCMSGTDYLSPVIKEAWRILQMPWLWGHESSFPERPHMESLKFLVTQYSSICCISKAFLTKIHDQKFNIRPPHSGAENLYFWYGIRYLRSGTLHQTVWNFFWQSGILNFTAWNPVSECRHVCSECQCLSSGISAQNTNIWVSRTAARREVQKQSYSNQAVQFLITM